jgi:hypothetical protein
MDTSLTFQVPAETLILLVLSIEVNHTWYAAIVAFMKAYPCLCPERSIPDSAQSGLSNTIRMVPSIKIQPSRLLQEVISSYISSSKKGDRKRMNLTPIAGHFQH